MVLKQNIMAILKCKQGRLLMCGDFNVVPGGHWDTSQGLCNSSQYINILCMTLGGLSLMQREFFPFCLMVTAATLE